MTSGIQAMESEHHGPDEDLRIGRPKPPSMERLRNGGGVARYHTRPTIGVQSVAAHSWGVAVICMRLSKGHPMQDVLYLYEAALLHDVAEYDTGDVPATAKWASPTLKSALEALEADVERAIGISTDKLKPWALWVLKFADMLELLWYCAEQRAMGNARLDHVWENGHAFLMKHAASALAVSGALNHQEALRLLNEVVDYRDSLFDSEPSSR